MTYRETREARVEKLRGWAGKRKADAERVFKQGERYRGDTAFNTQPGHIPERARLIAREERAYASINKAGSMTATAGEIGHQLDTSIYSDDADAVERLEERIEDLEKKRARIKAVNVAARKFKKGGMEPFATALAARQLGDLEITAAEASTLARSPCRWGDAGPFSPGYDGYVLQNLGGNITRQRQRLAQLKRDGGPPVKQISVRYAGECADCGDPIDKGSTAYYQRPDLRCAKCYEGKSSGRYMVRCVSCLVTIRMTDVLRESAAGGRCEKHEGGKA